MTTPKDPRRQRKITFNGLTAKEWTRLSRNVWNDVSSPREKYHLEHGATFSKALAARVITMYSKEGDLVLDPFLGTGTTLFAARELGRRGIGIELNEKFVKLARRLLSQKTLVRGPEQNVIHDDCRNLLKHVEPESVQVMLTSPPYANFIHKSIEDRKTTHKTSWIVEKNISRVKPYSDDQRDFGNLPYEDFLRDIKAVLEDLLIVTKRGGYNLWVVKDYRDTQRGIPYIGFHSDLGHIGEEVGFKYHDLIIWDQNDQRTLVLLGYPTVFYTNQNCSFLVVFRKPG